ncbi:hypothetical protein [Burkholderia gladioli]|uniref:hypothetical protein n=1 Tax=Burkholderia gladioli TaxID=28095 RepID=UPI0011B27153|nr:hypothetical protein [Burkholderia gladioli]
MASSATRTLNPLPFQDLEPRRFEDLIRQLVYDFRPWRRLEATGRAGTDDGFDARALEIVDAISEENASDFDEDDAVTKNSDITDRLWLVQCKRERAIGPTKAISHLNEIAISEEYPLYGLIFAAACDFSKKTRDAIFLWCRAHSISEIYIWGRGELEDMLFQPKNDNLLFAYFGISLSIRRRSLTSQIRSEIATKRKLSKTILLSSAEILVRDPAATEYPETMRGVPPDKWGVYEPERLTHYGLMLNVRWNYAYIDTTTGEWDAADVFPAMAREHYWSPEENEERRELIFESSQAWNNLPEKNRGWLKISGFIKIKDIMAVDEIGDDIFQGTHLYSPFQPSCGPFSGGFWVRIETISRFDEPISANDEKRIKKFPDRLRKP